MAAVGSSESGTPNIFSGLNSPLRARAFTDLFTVTEFDREKPAPKRA